MRKFNVLFFLILFQKTIPAYSQKETNNWFFGVYAGLNYNTNPPSVISNGKLNSSECSASVSDNNGNLLFYTNGDTVWDKNNNPMPNGFGLLQNAWALPSSTQGELIVKKPLSPNLYYIFSLGASGGFNSPFVFSIVDINANGGLGNVISKNNTILPKANYFEKLTAIKHCNNRDVWIIMMGIDPNYNVEDTTVYKTRSVFLYSFLLTPYGISNNPVISNLGNLQSASYYGQLKSNPQGTHLAFGNEYGYSILKFDKETGKVISTTNSNYPRINGYGLEFSPDGKLLYFNKTQIEVETGKRVELGYPTFSQFQLASDNKIYFVNYDSTAFTDPPTSVYILGKALSVINNPNTKGIGCNISYNNIILNDIAALGLPNFQSYYFYHPDGEFTYQNDCAGDSTIFTLINNPVLDSIKWLFSDGNTISKLMSPKHYFAAGTGSYDVTVITYKNNISDTIKQCVTINGAGTNAFTITDTTICKESKPITLGVSYPHVGQCFWNTNDTTAAITIYLPGTYWVTVTNNCGSYTSSINVNEVDCNSQTYTIIIPNVFTPNEDNNNDVFSVNIKNIEKISYSIYNRWGIKMKEETIFGLTPSNQKLVLWDGRTTAGIECTEGVYYYIINYTTLQNNEYHSKGFLSLVK